MTEAEQHTKTATMPTEATIVHRDYYRKRFNLQFQPITASKTLRPVDFASVLSVDPANFTANVVFTLPALDVSPAAEIKVVFESDSTSSYSFTVATASATATLNSGSLVVNGEAFQVVSQTSLLLGYVKKGSFITLTCTNDVWYVGGCVSLVNVSGIALTVPGQVLLVDGAAFAANTTITLPVAATMKGAKFSIVWSTDTNTSYSATISRSGSDSVAAIYAQGLKRNGKPFGKLSSATSVNVWKPQLGSRIDVVEVGGNWHLSGDITDDNVLTGATPVTVLAEHTGLSYGPITATATTFTLPTTITHLPIGWSLHVYGTASTSVAITFSGCNSGLYIVEDIAEAASGNACVIEYSRNTADGVGDKVVATVPSVAFNIQVTKVALNTLKFEVRHAHTANITAFTNV